ncbi:MAG: NAD(P)-dependent glycerol-3-phosphate dehydrogenase [Candidatus Eisenbacteria bacterium]|uniref:Glycerol-3-phosphate dehydrogenase [NAD(P)+] n=1 Tax=Eiseniibacteriota bacterium TaxID=2212470 RepID=A0A538TN03_UNCEI|nr:MAG: NAD(P)-dependent glycerol-3-phosphate dehydrogenase [Candidatus Eisenbacteria bacterium]
MKIGVIGGGGWGTALSIVLESRGHAVRLWVFEADLAEQMRRTRSNDRFLPDVRIPDAIEITSTLPDAAADADVLLFVTPSHALRATATRLAAEAEKSLKGVKWVTVATKGLETKTLRRMSEVLAETLPKGLGERVVVLAGPSHAEEVARRVPTLIVAASESAPLAANAQETFSTDWLRIYTNDDVIGVEIGVALKNVIAIASGIADGLGFGDSTRAALMTRGLAEISRLGEVLGARRETFAGLAGMGDLIATATSRHSRNRRLGEAIGRGATLKEALASSPMVVEGVGTAEAAVNLARRHGVELPIVEQVHAILYEGKSAKTAMRELLTRDLKPEAGTLSRR